jgi:hypothetical protein
MREKYPALRYSDNMWEDCKKGVWTIECDSWEKFEDRIKEYKQYKYLWRGQNCNKPLLPTIYRADRVSKKSVEKHLIQFKENIPSAGALKRFLKAANRTNVFGEALSEYYSMIHPEADKDPKENYVNDFIDDIYWAIGQHHGLRTPLLDWTKDPYKALFFAFCHRNEQHDKRVIFGLAEKSRLLLEKKQHTKRYIELLTNLSFVHRVLDPSDSPPDLKERIGRMFSRIKAQDGIFTKSLHVESVEQHAQRCYSFYQEHRNEEIVFLLKILIPDGVRENILEKLEGKGIAYKTMFPDLQGTALHCNLKIESRQ